MNCPFCQNPFTIRNPTDLAGHCGYCPPIHNLKYLTYNSSLNYSQDKGLKSTIDTIHYKLDHNGFLYWIYIDYAEKRTKVHVYHGLGHWQTLLNLPGDPLTPENVRHKLHLYLVFS